MSYFCSKEQKEELQNHFWNLFLSALLTNRSAIASLLTGILMISYSRPYHVTGVNPKSLQTFKYRPRFFGAFIVFLCPRQ